MDEFDNLFDEALSDADRIIIETMGRQVTFVINGKPVPARAVFDDPEANTSLPGGAATVEDVAPTLFVKTALITGLKKRDAVMVAGKPFWVVNIGPDDTGSSVITLACGAPHQEAPPRRERK